MGFLPFVKIKAGALPVYRYISNVETPVVGLAPLPEKKSRPQF
jgi:hypothetical protein